MHFNNNNLPDANFGYSMPENDNNLGPSGFNSGVNYGEPPANPASGFDLADLSAAEIEDWRRGPGPEGNAGQYAGSTLLGPPGGELVDVYGLHPGQSYCPNGFNADNAYGFDGLSEQTEHTHEPAGPSMAGPPTVPLPLPTYQQLPHLPTTFAGPIFTSPPVPALPWPLSPPSVSYPDAGNYLTGEGEGRAMAHFPSPYPPLSGNTMWQYPHPHLSRDYDAGLNLQMGAGLPNIGPPIQIAASTGPQRSIKGAKGKGKEMGEGQGKRKRIPRAAPLPGFDWPSTSRRFCAKVAEICYNQPTGEVTTPETAYARINKFIKEDLHLSPLVVKDLGVRQCRDVEQYLTGVLNELHPRLSVEKRGVRYLLERVANKLENELVAVNGGFALLDGPSNSEVDPEELDASEVAVKRRTAEQIRRTAIRGSLERMTLFFKLPEGFVWSRPQVLFFAITYLVFGAGVLGGEGGFFTPKPQP